MKDSSLVARKLLSEISINIENVEAINVQGPSQQALDMHSRILRKMHSQVHPNFFEEAKGHVFIDDSPLSPKKKIVLVFIARFFFAVALGKFADVSKSSIFIGLFNPRHDLDSNFWNELASEI